MTTVLLLGLIFLGLFVTVLFLAKQGQATKDQLKATEEIVKRAKEAKDIWNSDKPISDDFMRYRD